MAVHYGGGGGGGGGEVGSTRRVGGEVAGGLGGRKGDGFP